MTHMLFFVQGFYELLLSEGSIVVLPYLLAEDGPDQDYGDQICNNMTKIFSKVTVCTVVRDILPFIQL